MTSNVPAPIAWTVITVLTLLLAARFAWCRANLYETYLNNVMAWLLLAQLLRERAVEAILSDAALMSVTTAQQVSCVAMNFACVEFIGFTMLWSRMSPAETRRIHRYFRLATVALCVAFLAAGTRARVAGQSLEVNGGWQAVWALGFYLTTITVMLARLLWMFGSELRKATATRERLLAAAGLIAVVVTAAFCLEAVVLAVTDQLGLTHTVKFRLALHGSEFLWMAVALYLFGAVPLTVRLLSYLGLDRVSRSWRGLQPLRQSITALVPESRFNLEEGGRRFQKTTLQLHQTVIEIRDAILQLRPYSRDVAPEELVHFITANAVPTDEVTGATAALELAHAVRAINAGRKPEPPDTTLVVRGRSTSLDEEAADLLALARWWAPACAVTERLSPLAREPV